MDPLSLRIGMSLRQYWRTRFAPSPTGYLHLGHVVNALYVWGVAGLCQAEVVLRLENHDRTRCRPEFEEALLADLEWLGLGADMGLPAEFRAGRCDYRQSDCNAEYEQAMDRLLAMGRTYVCDCSRKRILARTGQEDAEELRYDGYCRDRGLQDGTGMTVRFRVAEGDESFEDLLIGPQVQCPQLQVGDFALRDNHGNWTYQFAVVVDDLRHGVNLIVRGTDILSSTGRQLQLMRALGGTSAPIYLHHALLTDTAGRKLSKRDFAKDIHSRFLAGEPASAVYGEAAVRAGWLERYEPLEREQALGLVKEHLLKVLV